MPVRHDRKRSDRLSEDKSNVKKSIGISLDIFKHKLIYNNYELNKNLLFFIFYINIKSNIESKTTLY